MFNIIFVLLFLPIKTFCYTLITFDVDGTLVAGSGRAASEGAHARAFSHAVSNVLGNGAPIPPVSEALPRELYHGSTDGLILLRLAKATLNINSKESYPKLQDMFACMFQYINSMENDEIGEFISPLPGVIDQLKKLSNMKDEVICGLVTGNVEGIARRKMNAVGIFETNALHPPCETQKKWDGTSHISFLGGFGSDYCSGDIDDVERNHLDRGEQIAIATQRGENILGINKKLKRVVHVGDAPADVLAAKWYSEAKTDNDLCVGMVAVATGSYTSNELRELAGEAIPGQWEPVILDDGMASDEFLNACGLKI